MSTKEFQVNKKGYIRLEKDGQEQDFVPESVPVWLADGWSVVDDKSEKPKLAPAEAKAVKESQTVLVNVPDDKK